MPPYWFGKTVATTYEETIARATAALAEEGFGVLTQIDVKATLKKKLDKDVRPCMILGACNPGFAHRVLELEPQLATLLPCNVVVRVDAAGRTVVEAMDPDAVMQVVQRADVAAVASEVRGRLERALAKL